MGKCGHTNAKSGARSDSETSNNHVETGGSSKELRATEDFDSEEDIGPMTSQGPASFHP